MAKSVSGLLCCPSCKGTLITETVRGGEGRLTERFSCQACHKQYENTEGYIDFLDDEGIKFRSGRERFMRSVYAKTYTPVTNFMFLFCGGAKSARDEVMGRLKLKDGDYILETGMGYGENFLWLDRHMKGLKLFGVDIQREMMVKCNLNLLKWKIGAQIVRANAQSLPFRNGVFDVVFHLGAINLFDDKEMAIREMIRVARPGTHIVIADETEKAGRLFKIFTGPAEKIIPPVDMVPGTMKNISLSTIWRGYGYVIEFDTI